ncbi:MAG: site-specific DNA-methyltransferase [Dehalococcoidia bacterium]|nr:site-specific DNA-methyltransferase [Dehalococcoidia bacterium]
MTTPEPFLAHAARLVRAGGALVSFTSELLFAPYLASGLDHRGLLYWRKSNPAPNFRKQIVRAVEMAVWQTQGGGWTFNAGGYRVNVWDGPVLNGVAVQNTDEKRIHPTQKPLWLIREWIQLFSNPGDLILDPFAGSLTTAVAAHQLGRRCIAIEMDCGYVEAGVERLRQGVLL